MIDSAEMARILEVAAFKARNLLDVPTEELMIVTAHLAQSFIGHYQSGWAPLKPSTVDQKTRLGYAPPDNPLLRTGELRDSIEAAAALDPTGAIGVVGSKDKVALYQEMGTSKIPPRMSMGLAMHETYASADRIFGDFAVKILTRP